MTTLTVTESDLGLSEAPIGPRDDEERFQWKSLLMLGPSFVLLAALMLFPVGYAFYVGFTNLQLIGPFADHSKFTGLANVDRLIHDPTFGISLRVTAIFLVGSVVGVLLVGLALAVLLQKSGAIMRTLVGGVVVVAWMMPAVSAGMTWYASTTAGGTFSALLRDPNADFLHAQPILIVTLANVWSSTGFAMLVLSAALRNIQGEVLEAADIEGASPWQRFRSITLPLLRPTIIVTGLLVFLLSLANFSLVYVMTQGGPGESTNILPIYSYLQAFQFYNLGYGALIGDALVLISAVAGVIYVKVSRIST
jgi:multiple sugar transport system permease protein